jgi:putative membrane protein
VTELPADGEWRRLHPLTPLLRGGRTLLVLLGVLGSQGLRDRPPVLLTVAVLAVATVLAALAGWVSWRTTRFRLSGGELQVDSGVLVKRARRVPLARVQSIDVVRPLIARLLGLAELRLEVVGGGETEAPLSYLSEPDAQRLRAQLLSTGGATGAPPPEQLLVRVPTGVLVTSVLLSGPVVLTVALVPVLLVVLAIEPQAALPALAALVPAFLGVGSVAVRRVLNGYGSTVSESPEGLRLRHGLLDTRSQTVPAGRVQGVRVREPLLWRAPDWAGVDVDVAGYAARGEEQAGTSALLPVAPRQLATAVVARVLGGDLPVADRPVPRRARWRAPLSHRRLRVGVDARHLVVTSGVLTTTTDIVPLAKVQSLRLTQGPWQRRLGLADVRADTAGRRLPGAVARHRDADEARALLVELTGLARAARR